MKISDPHLASFFRQLSSLLETGMPIREALTHFADRRQKGNILDLAQALGGAITEGKTLMEALEVCREAISPTYRAMMIAGEASGRLPEVLGEMADSVEEGIKRKRRLRLALLHPIFVLMVASAAIVLLVNFVLPRFASFFESSNTELPAVTRSLMATGDFLGNVLPLGVILIFGLVCTGMVLATSPAGRFLFDGYAVLISPFRGLHQKEATSNCARALGMLQEAGVPIVRSVLLAAEASGNAVVERVLLQANTLVDGGQPLSEALGNPKGLVPEFIVALRAGERTGTMDKTLKRLAHQLDAEVAHARRMRMIIGMNLTLIFLGIMVGWIVIAIVSAYFGLVSAVL